MCWISCKIYTCGAHYGQHHINEPNHFVVTVNSDQGKELLHGGFSKTKTLLEDYKHESHKVGQRAVYRTDRSPNFSCDVCQYVLATWMRCSGGHAL